MSATANQVGAGSNINIAMPPHIHRSPRPMAATYHDRMAISPHTKPLTKLPPACATSTMIKAPVGVPLASTWALNASKSLGSIPSGSGNMAFETLTEEIAL